MNRYNTITDEQIRTGSAADDYFGRTEASLKHADRNPTVVAEITADQFPTGGFEVFSGLQSAVELLAGNFVDIDVYAYPEGEQFDGGPVMRIEGDYLEFARHETSLLGFLSHASGIATAAYEVTSVAGEDNTVLSFGARHVHPKIAVVVERNALIGGVDGISHVAAGDLLNVETSGTMPHALMLAFNEDTPKAAFKAFNESQPENVPRIALCDTFTDEAVEVEQAVEAMGDDLEGVRLDTTSSRRGNFRHIIKEVQYKLEQLDREDVDIYVSGGITPSDITELRDVVTGFGVGSYISNADPVDFSLDIVEVNGKETSKRGKLGGVKEPYRLPNGETKIVQKNSDETPPENAEQLLQPVIKNGEKLVDEFSIEKAAQRAQNHSNPRS